MAKNKYEFEKSLKDLSDRLAGTRERRYCTFKKTGICTCYFSIGKSDEHTQSEERHCPFEN